MFNLWTHDERVRAFVFARRFARAAAELMGVAGVRLYHDQALFKEPGGGITPWHQDQFYWPLDTDAHVTLWMPLVRVTPEMGPMTLRVGLAPAGQARRSCRSATSRRPRSSARSAEHGLRCTAPERLRARRRHVPRRLDAAPRAAESHRASCAR